MKRYILSFCSIIIISSIFLWFIGTVNAKSSLDTIAANFTLKDLSGKQVSLNDYRGKVVLINFWATWCAPCLREMPYLEKLHQNYKDKNVQILGIAVVSNIKDIPRKVKTVGITYPILLGNKEIIAAYGYFYSIPHTFIIGPDGKILKQLAGSYDYSHFEEEIKTALLK